jgi:hypothetical protein
MAGASAGQMIGSSHLSRSQRARHTTGRINGPTLDHIAPGAPAKVLEHRYLAANETDR